MSALGPQEASSPRHEGLSVPRPMRSGAGMSPRAAERSAPYRDDNLLDRISRPSTLETHYRHVMVREQRVLAGRLGISRGDVLSVGCGWHPGRHLFPAPAFR